MFVLDQCWHVLCCETRTLHLHCTGATRHTWHHWCQNQGTVGCVACCLAQFCLVTSSMVPTCFALFHVTSCQVCCTCEYTLDDCGCCCSCSMIVPAALPLTAMTELPLLVGGNWGLHATADVTACADVVRYAVLGSISINWCAWWSWFYFGSRG